MQRIGCNGRDSGWSKDERVRKSKWLGLLSGPFLPIRFLKLLSIDLVYLF